MDHAKVYLLAYIFKIYMYIKEMLFIIKLLFAIRFFYKYVPNSFEILFKFLLFFKF